MRRIGALWIGVAFLAAVGLALVRCNRGDVTTWGTANTARDGLLSTPGRLGPTAGRGIGGGPGAALPLAGFDELWVIERPTGAPSPGAEDEAPGCGSLLAERSGERVPVPLAHTGAEARISGPIASVVVTQTFQNPFDTKIEAVYVFPLPRRSAVHDFVMTIGERRIRGVIREREEARRIYESAKHAGHVASLLDQERPNVFTQRVANIEPLKEIDVSIEYFQDLDSSDGTWEFVFPMVVGPRFNPPCSTGGIAAVPRGSTGASGQPVEVSYLRPGERSGHDIDLSVEIDAGATIQSIESPSHAVEIERPRPDAARVRLAATNRIPNRDFVLRYRVAPSGVEGDFLVHREGNGGYFALLLQPPAELAELPLQPLELILVLDCSGSMQGRPLEQAKACARHALRLLGPRDAFQIIRFSERASALGSGPVVATPENVARGLAYLEGLSSGGGTMMVEGIRAALDFRYETGRLRFVAFLTDGYIGNEEEIFREVDARLGPARIFSFGVGNAVNRYLLAGLAHLGRGAAAFVGLDEDPIPAVGGFFQRIRRPALADIAVDWGGLAVSEVAPQRIPDLFVGRPVLISGRFEGAEAATVTVRGNVAGAERKVSIRFDPAYAASREEIAHIWARRRLAYFMEALVRAPSEEVTDEARRFALERGLLSAFTSFVAVDSLSVTEGTHGVTVPVPVPVPDGVLYETTVGR